MAEQRKLLSTRAAVVQNHYTLMWCSSKTLNLLLWSRCKFIAGRKRVKERKENQGEEMNTPGWGKIQTCIYKLISLRISLNQCSFKALGIDWQLNCRHIFTRLSYRLCSCISFPHWHLAELLKLSRLYSRNIETRLFRETRQWMIKGRILALFSACLRKSVRSWTILFY